MEILVDISNQKLRIASNLKNLVSGTQEFVKFTFNLGDDWDGLTVFAQFKQEDTAYNQYLDDNNSVYLPSEIGAGKCTLMLYGVGGDVRATTNYLTLFIDQNILVSDAQSTEISQSLYDQLVNDISAMEDRFAQIIGLAEDGVFNQGSPEYEVIDARTGDNGITYSKLGDAIRGQFRELKNSVATNAEFIAAIGDEGIETDDAVEEVVSELQTVLESAESFQRQLDDLSDSLNKVGKSNLTFTYLADSFVDRLALDENENRLCWSAQFMTVGDGFMYVFREGEAVTNAQGNVLTVDGEYVAAEEVEAGTYIPQKYGHIQKLSLTTLEKNTEIASVASEPSATVASVNVQVGHGGGACYGKIGDNWYLIVAPGGDEKALYFLHPDFSEWENTQSATLRVSTGDVSMSSIAYDSDHDVYYRIIQRGGDNGFHRTLQRFQFDTNFAVTDVVDVASVAINYYQGLCYCDGRLYTITYGSNCIIAIDATTGAILRRISVPLTAGASLMTEPEAVYVARNGDVYVYGSCNLSGSPYGGISNSTIWKSNLTTGGVSYPYLLNVRNATDSYWIHAVADNEDGDYAFTFKRGNSGSPCNSIWTALMMAYAHYVNGRTGQARILWKIPMTREKYVFKDLPFRFYLTSSVIVSDDETNENDVVDDNGFYSTELTRESNLKFTGCNAAIDISSDGTLTLEQGNYTVNADFGGYIFERGAFGTINRTGDQISLVTTDDNRNEDGSFKRNFMIAARDVIFTHGGTIPYTPYS